MSSGLSMAFGMPPKAEPSPEAQSQVPTVLVLSALVNNGSFAAWQPIVAGMSRPQLEAAFGQWLMTNSGRYGGQITIRPVPFLLPEGSAR